MVVIVAGKGPTQRSSIRTAIDFSTELRSNVIMNGVDATSRDVQGIMFKLGE